MYQLTQVSLFCSVYEKSVSGARFRRPNAPKRRVFDYLRQSFSGSASAVALAGTMLAPFGAVLGTPNTAEAGSTINLVGPDFSNGVYNAKEDDQDLRIGLSVAFDSFTHRHTVTVEVNGGQPSDWTFTGTSGSFDPQTGVWSISFSPGISVINATPKFSFSNNSDVNHTLTIRAQQFDASNNLVSETVRQATVKIDAVADTPDLALSNTQGGTSQNILLPMSVNLVDADGSEQIAAILIEGVPGDATLSAGQDQGGGEWLLLPGDLPVSINKVGPGTVLLTVTAMTEEANLDDFDDDPSDNSASATGNLTVAVNTAPTITPTNVDYSNGVYNAKEDDSDLKVKFLILFDTTTQTHTARVEGIPSTWVHISGGGSFDPLTGVWTISTPGGSSINGGPTFSFADNSDTNSVLTIRAQQFDASGALVSETTRQVTVKIDAVADTPDLATAGSLSTTAGENTPLAVAAALNDADGSETLAIELRGLPVGASANLGQEVTPGVWRIEGAELGSLAQLELTFPAPGQFAFTVAAIATETNLDDPDDSLADNQAEATRPITADVALPTLCPDTPHTACLPAVSALLTLKDADPTKDKVKAQWKGETALADFANPALDTNFGLCLYDKTGALVVAAAAEAGGLCPFGGNQKPCWKEKPNGKGFTFTDNGLEPDGLQKATLTPAKPGKANGSLNLQGKGGNLPLPGPQEAARYLADSSEPATLQIHRLGPGFERQCWTASLGDEKKNTATDYFAKCGGKNRPACAP